MTTLRQAAVAALEALEITSSEYCQGCWLEVIAALKEALARPDQLEDCKKILIERTASLTKANYRLEQLNKQEPTAWMDAVGDLTFRTPSVKLRPYWTPLYLHSAPIPEGWVMVPKEPTAAMDFAGAKAADEMMSANISKSIGPLGGHVVRDDYDDITLAYVNDEISGVMGIYKAMLVAAPKPKKELVTERCQSASSYCRGKKKRTERDDLIEQLTNCRRELARYKEREATIGWADV